MTDQPGSRAASIAQPRRARRNHWNNQVEIHSDMRPNDVAFRFGGTDTTWKQLHQRTEALADALARRGIGFGDRVLVVMLNHTEYIESVLAVNSLGAIAVPVNFRLSPPELAYLASDSGATGVVTDGMLAPLVAALRAQVRGLEVAVVLGDVPVGDAQAYESLIAEEGPAYPPVDIPEDTPALIMYTSGTTGSPKGAILSHANLQAQAFTCIRALQTDQDSVYFCAAPLFHIAGLGSIAPNIVLGIKTVIAPLGAFDASATLDAWERERATSVFLVPAQWQVICADPAVRQRDLALRVISWGAAPASDTLLRAMAETFPDAMNVAVFGQTEMSPITCVLDGADAIRKLGSVGKPIPTIATRVVDENMNDVARGEIGEIVYRGPTMMQGYRNKPAATADAFEGGWFHSGDLVRQDADGFVYVVDRKKDMIISGGENIYCAEVENVLFAHPKVREAAVIGRAGEKWGEVPVAVVAGDESLTLAELEPFLNDRLARYKHPKALVVVDELPRNASGKVVKPELRRRFAPVRAL